MVSDRVGDFIIRLKNAGAIGKEEVSLAYSAHLEAIAKKLAQLGFVADVKKDERTLTVVLAYDERGRHKIEGVKRVSKPGRRLYTPSRAAHSVRNGMGARLISTPKGILSDAEARKLRAGGETLFDIW